MTITSIIILSLIVVLTNAYYLNYHDAVGIPAAARIRERETRAILGEPDFGISTRVVHGTEADVGANPWLAGLIITLGGKKNLQSVCGASLISRNRLATAAHCCVQEKKNGELQQALSFEVVLGSQYLFYGGTRIETKTAVPHPKWGENHIYHSYDAAVIYLNQDVTFNENISPITLPLDYIDESFSGRLTIGAGYGRINDGQRTTGIFRNASIHQVVLKVITNDECARYLKGVTPCDLCTSGYGGVGICQGDSGGPLVTKDKVPLLIGITAGTAIDSCEKGTPSVFTRVTKVLDFINEHL